MVLVSIVGDFYSSVLPIIYEFKDQIKKHVLLYDTFSHESYKAKQIAFGIKSFKKRYGLTFETLEYVVKAESLAAFKECADALLLYGDNPKDIYINSTDGFATLNTVINHRLFKDGVNFIGYDMYNNHYNLLNRLSFSRHTLKNKMSISEHFLLKGVDVQKSKVKEFAKEYKGMISDLITKHYQEYDAFLEVDSNKYATIKQLPKRYKNIRNIFIKNGFEKAKVKDQLLTGSVFEAYIYNLIKKLPFDDIEIGFRVFQHYKNARIANEFDILVMKDNHLHMIECKYLKNPQIENLIYKYTALSPSIDEEAKMILVTKKSPEFTKEIEADAHKGLVYKRGLLHNIKVLGDVRQNPKAFVKEVKEYFGLED
jgi:hypothetical protein